VFTAINGDMYGIYIHIYRYKHTVPGYNAPSDSTNNNFITRYRRWIVYMHLFFGKVHVDTTCISVKQKNVDQIGNT
jgi:hypothetical protein